VENFNHRVIISISMIDYLGPLSKMGLIEIY